MISEYFLKKRHEDHGDKFFYEVLLPDLFLFAIIISICVALLIFIFRTLG